MEFLGWKLKHIMDERGTSLKEMADEIGVKPAYLSQVLRGVKKNLRSEMVDKIAKATGLHKNYFFIEDAMTLRDVFPDLSPEIEAFLANSNNLPYLILSEKAKKSGVTPERLQQILDLLDISKK
jgi:Predicted transcriptional regulators